MRGCIFNHTFWKGKKLCQFVCIFTCFKAYRWIYVSFVLPVIIIVWSDNAYFWFFFLANLASRFFYEPRFNLGSGNSKKWEPGPGPGPCILKFMTPGPTPIGSYVLVYEPLFTGRLTFYILAEIYLGYWPIYHKYVLLYIALSFLEARQWRTSSN